LISERVVKKLGLLSSPPSLLKLLFNSSSLRGKILLLPKLRGKEEEYLTTEFRRSLRGVRDRGLVFDDSACW